MPPERRKQDIFEFPRVPHYYGDAVRTLFISSSVLMIVGAPFYSDDYANVQYIVIGVIAMVALAAMTNPRKMWLAVCDAIVSGIGLGVYGTWALHGYHADEPLAYVLRGAIAVLFLFTFYFSMKTMRAMMMRQVGKREDPETLDE